MVNNRYRLELTPHSLKIQPHYYLLKKDFKWYVILLAASVLCSPFVGNYVGETGLIIDLAVGMLMLFYILRDYFLKINIRYVFDRSTRSIYKSNPPFVSNKPVIRFDEMTIFTCSECGSWYYTMGIKQKQFLKNYCISEPFDSGKKSTQRQQDYERQILSKIEELVAINQNINA